MLSVLHVIRLAGVGNAKGLLSHCLNTVGDEFEMHGLVQLSTRSWLKGCGQQETFKRQYIELKSIYGLVQYEDNWASILPLTIVAINNRDITSTGISRGI
ncbi:hypothetical protein QBC38DRAFT_191136 [Podospora fimiseda]|uniref:Uncharacterized protein n=1 Tax=Podospora fimiseda TaxID=252190 RepID=A0AAN6YL62_9PEZI|nr:hypothetical protein QBC38DRAFT_191136 [Podospora fimiseda]